MSATQAASGITHCSTTNHCTPQSHQSLHCSASHKSNAPLQAHAPLQQRGYGSLTASPSVFEENESCGDACARQLPSLEWIKAYDFAWLWNDVAGGITLGLVLLAQSLGARAPLRRRADPGPLRLPARAPGLRAARHVPRGVDRHGRPRVPGRERAARARVRDAGGAVRPRGDVRFAGRAGPVRHGAAPAGVPGRFLSRPALSGFISGSALLIIKSMSGPMVGGHLGHAHRSTALLSAMCLAWLFAAKPLATAARGTALERLAEARRGSRRSWPWPSRAPPSL